MKAFIIHTPHKKSVEYANACLKSFDQYTGWEPELFEGVTPETLPEWEEKYPLKIKEHSRAKDFEREKNPCLKAKKSCSYNHYRLFKKCAELSEPISIIEHDSDCVDNWNNYLFEDVLVMNAKSAIKLNVFEPIWKINKHKIKKGIHDICFNGLNYRHDSTLTHAHMMPGTAAYAITPKGAAKMINVYENIGWEQSDFIINTAYVRIQTIIPELFTFNRPNLTTSHGNYGRDVL